MKYSQRTLAPGFILHWLMLWKHGLWEQRTSLFAGAAYGTRDLWGTVSRFSVQASGMVTVHTIWGTEERNLYMINRLQQGLGENPCLVCTRLWVRTLGLQNQRLKSAFRIGSAVLLDWCDL